MSIDRQHLKALLAEERLKNPSQSHLPFEDAIPRAALGLGPRLRWEIAEALSPTALDALLAEGAERQGSWFAVPPLLRRDLLREVHAHPQAQELLRSALNTLCVLQAATGEPLHRWQTLLADASDPLTDAATIGATLVRLVHETVDCDLSAAFAWMTAARGLDDLLGGALHRELLLAGSTINSRHERLNC